MYHVPVMLQECLDGLAIKPDGIYVDVTFGGGGHSKAILEKLDTGKLIAFDQDIDAKANAEVLKSDNFILAESNFRHLKRYLRLHNIEKVDGILADLGISSHQIDTAERGFSIRYDADLDMRMNQSQELGAKEIVNDYDEEKLANVLWKYGELRNSRHLAKAIMQERVAGKIQTTGELINVIKRYAKRGKENTFYAQVFQALRMETNDEMGALYEMLEQGLEVLNEDGRFVVMAYHSLEDRPVKNFFRSGNFEGKVEKDFYGNPQTPFKQITRKPTIADQEELAINPRARSAKLRIVEKKIM
ncbi:MAG: 16S rRNA (cytosine1402-N4)-methyltransferase [Flammeovirgaceae bacterium]|jgi:16S rRNA (cytosine1402-N4)-methyltransferase